MLVERIAETPDSLTHPHCLFIFEAKENMTNTKQSQCANWYDNSTQSQRRSQRTMPTQSPKPIYQILISLRGSKPLIWRRVLVKRTITFENLHYVAQLSMGWTNSHLHQLVVGRTIITDMDFELEGFGGNVPSDEKGLKLALKEHELPFEMRYEYDFGDGWLHDIVVEKMIAADPLLKYPHCLEGEMHCPPEDCGGLGGYANLLKTLGNKNDPERAELVEWLGGEFDATAFDLAAVNRELKNIAKWKRWAKGE